MTYASPMTLSQLPPDLDRIRTLMLQMWVRAESMVTRACRSVLQRDPHMARAVMKDDRALDQLEIEIDSLCVKCLALNQPIGYELRFVTTVLKMVTDLERIGDYAVNIAERGLELGAGHGLEPGEELAAMGREVVVMLGRAADAFVVGDAGAYDEIVVLDQQIDARNRAAFERWLAVMASHPDQVDRALAYTSISRHLERIADHAVNLAQMNVLLVDGRDVRHARG
jgi:phosphate transport system protein